MTDKQENHLKYLKDHFIPMIDSKYRIGAAEHGGNLHELTMSQLIDAALDETIDQYVYLMTLKEKLNRPA